MSTKPEIIDMSAPDDCRLPTADCRRLGSRWWLDASLVTYSGPGEPVSLAEAEGRLARAILTDGLRRHERPQAWHGVGTVLGQLVAGTVNADDVAAMRDRFQPTPRDMTDYERGVPMGWLCALDPPELRWRGRPPWTRSQAQDAICLHALGLTWRQIGRRMAISGQSAHEGYVGSRTRVSVIERIRRAANAEPVWDHMTPVDQMAALRQRNREARG